MSAYTASATSPLPTAPVADAPSAAPVLESASSITLEQPSGAVALVEAGDALGQRRYAARRSVGGASVVRFSLFPVAVPSAAPLTGSPSIADLRPWRAAMPINRGRLTSLFGPRLHPTLGGWRRHKGIDVAAPHGTPVRAASDGTVSVSGWQGGYGIAVRIQHPGGVETRYAHLSRTAVSAGQTVSAGDVIGYVGSTGRSTGAHLHYEVRRGQTAIDPLR